MNADRTLEQSPGGPTHVGASHSRPDSVPTAPCPSWCLYSTWPVHPEGNYHRSQSRRYVGRHQDLDQELEASLLRLDAEEGPIRAITLGAC